MVCATFFFLAVRPDDDDELGPKVDKYGRSVSADQQGENLRKYYRLEEDEKRKPDLARGEVVLESSDEDEADSEEEGGFVTLGGEQEVDLDEDNYADLDLQAESYSQAYAKQEKDDEETTRTSRLAIVNLDWDHVRAHHLYKICSSLVSSSAPHSAVTGLEINYARHKGTSKGTPHDSHAHPRVVRGQVRSVRIYPSEFGKGRMEREEKEGPPKEIFKKNRRKDELEEEDVNEKTVYEVGDGEEGECDVDALRRYQLERLR